MYYRALAEIDEVVGDSEIIEKKHIDGLEYIQAVSLCVVHERMTCGFDVYNIDPGMLMFPACVCF